jgi:hypothetical protein
LTIKKVAERIQRESVGVNARIHVTWICSVSDPRHRPGGLKQSDGCGWCNILTTRKNLSQIRTQTKCSNPNCTVPNGRRKRIGREHVRMHLDKISAKQFAEGSNFHLTLGGDVNGDED